MKKHIAVVQRVEENLVAVVSYKTKSDIDLDPNSVMDLLVVAVTEWVSNTAEGQLAWKHSSEDLNIGDLSNYLRNISLQDSLHANDIWELDINIVGTGDSPSRYIYDTVLVEGL